MLDLFALPDDVRALIEAQAPTIARQDAELLAHRAVVEALRLQLARLRRMRFGRSSERLDAEIAQLTLALEDLLDPNGCANVVAAVSGSTHRQLKNDATRSRPLPKR